MDSHFQPGDHVEFWTPDLISGRWIYTGTATVMGVYRPGIGTRNVLVQSDGQRVDGPFEQVLVRPDCAWGCVSYQWVRALRA